jgi:hypothetical protein
MNSSKWMLKIASLYRNIHKDIHITKKYASYKNYLNKIQGIEISILMR